MPFENGKCVCVKGNMKLFTVFFKCQALVRRQIWVQRVQRQRSILRHNPFSKREWMAPDKPVYQKKAETPTSIFLTGTICSRWQSKVLMNKKKKTGNNHLVPLLILTLLLCITKHGSCERVGVKWPDFGAKATLVVFLAPRSLFAPSLRLATP